jgi:hypothetical protein
LRHWWCSGTGPSAICLAPKRFTRFFGGMGLTLWSVICLYLCWNLICPYHWTEHTIVFIGLACQGKDTVFRFIIEYSSLMAFGP